MFSHKFLLVLAWCCCFTSSRRRHRRLQRCNNWINHSRSTFLQRRRRQQQINRVNKLDFNEILLIEKNAYIWKNKLYSAYDIQDVNILCLNIFFLSLYPPLKRGPYRLPGPCVLLTATWSKTSTLVLQARTQKKDILLQSKREESRLYCYNFLHSNVRSALHLSIKQNSRFLWYIIFSLSQHHACTTPGSDNIWMNWCAITECFLRQNVKTEIERKGNVLREKLSKMGFVFRWCHKIFITKLQKVSIIWKNNSKLVSKI